MKIALAILHADPARGGAERYTVDLAAALAARGHDVTLVTAAASPAILGVETIVLPYSGPTRLRRYLRYIDALDDLRHRRAFDRLHAMLPVRGCDIYHPHAGLAAQAVNEGHRSKATPWQQAVAKLGNRFNAKRQRFAAVERSLLESPNPPVVLGLSNYVNAAIRRSYPTLPESRLVTLFNAVDLKRFDPAARPDAGGVVRQRFGIPGEAVVGVMLAQDFARKGLSEAIAALAQANDVRLRLIVAGKQNSSVYERFAGKLGVRSQVHFAGVTDDPYAFYAAAQFYILPTRHDPCSLGVLEALSMGVPVISTIYNGACEVMTDGIHGRVLTNPSDIPALTAAMRVYLASGKRAEQSTACLLLRPTLSNDAHLNCLIQVYEKDRIDLRP